jgi:hypothetical protein
MMRREFMLIIAAATFGLAGGYGWSVLTAKPPRAARAAKAAFMPLPTSPEEQPLAPDAEWTASADDTNASAVVGNAAANGGESP